MVTGKSATQLIDSLDLSRTCGNTATKLLCLLVAYLIFFMDETTFYSRSWYRRIVIGSDPLFAYTLSNGPEEAKGVARTFQQITIKYGVVRHWKLHHIPEIFFIAVSSPVKWKTSERKKLWWFKNMYISEKGCTNGANEDSFTCIMVPNASENRGLTNDSKR